MAQVRSRYDRFRGRYYKDDNLPESEDVDFEWMTDRQVLGRTILTEDQPTVQLHEILRSFPRLFDVILLHEMSHIRRPKAECHHGSKAWREEAQRLGALGAMEEFF